MKQRILGCILIVVLLFISGFTVYIILNPSIKDVKKEIKVKEIEKTSSIVKDNTLTEIFNIYMNKEKYRLKSEYKLNDELSLTLYLNGEKILEDILVEDASELKDDWLNSNLIIEVENIEVINLNDNKYILINVLKKVKNFDKVVQYIYQGNGDLLLDGLVLYDDSVSYLLDDNIFYDSEKQITTLISAKSIKTLKFEEKDDQTFLTEYEYKIVDDKFEEKMLKQYEVKLESGD